MNKPTLLRSLGLIDATMLVVGCIVGVGIFRTSASIARQVPSPALILALWVFGGLLSLCGALCYAELAAAFPKSGGDYIYITNIYGRFWGFLFGWTKLFIERTGTIAILGFVFAEYLGSVLGYDEHVTRWIASLAVILLTAVNTMGIRWGKYVQNLFTSLKIASLCAIVWVGVVAGRGRVPSFAGSSMSLSHASVWQALGVALVFVLWTYGGWTEAAYVTEEVKQPQRNVPRALVGGVLLTTVLYVAVNLAYLCYVPIEQMPKAKLVASTMMQQAIGPAGVWIIGAIVACSAFGALNGYILTGGRILYAIGRDHKLFEALGSLSPRFHTPVAALWLNAAISAALIFTKTLDQIMTYSTVVISIFFTMAVFGVMVLRRAQPELPRPYRAWGYPLVPLIYGLVTIGFIVDVCVEQRADSLFGLGLLALGLPLYGISQWLGRRADAPMLVESSSAPLAQ